MNSIILVKEVLTTNRIKSSRLYGGFNSLLIHCPNQDAKLITIHLIHFIMKTPIISQTLKFPNTWELTDEEKLEIYENNEDLILSQFYFMSDSQIDYEINALSDIIDLTSEGFKEYPSEDYQETDPDWDDKYDEAHEFNMSHLYDLDWFKVNLVDEYIEYYDEEHSKWKYIQYLKDEYKYDLDI